MELKHSYSNQSKYCNSVDCVMLGYEDDSLKLLLYPRRFKPSEGDWSLMGGFLQPNETMDESTKRVLKLTVGLENIFMEQVGGFSRVDRDPGARVISQAYYALIRIDKHDKALVSQHGGRWFDITKLPTLIFDHDEMVSAALKKLQDKATFNLIGKELLPDMFTLTMLNNLYNAIFQRQFDAGNFRKKLASLNVLDKLAIKDTSSSKRGAYYYKFSEDKSAISNERIVKI